MVADEREQMDVLGRVVLHELDEECPQGRIAKRAHLPTQSTQLLLILPFGGKEPDGHLLEGLGPWPGRQVRSRIRGGRPLVA
jgi:hypothetical protein